MASPGDSFSHKVRIRVCGVLIENDSILLVQLKSPVTNKLIWTPPGGGLEFGETMNECLKREFVEETGIDIEVKTLFHVNELIKQPYHAIEFYFTVKASGGSLKAGYDPELPDDRQMLQDVQWKLIDDIASLSFAPESLANKIRNSDSDQAAGHLFPSS